jgi:hypothetical protein
MAGTSTRVGSRHAGSVLRPMPSASKWRCRSLLVTRGLLPAGLCRRTVPTTLFCSEVQPRVRHVAQGSPETGQSSECSLVGAHLLAASPSSVTSFCLLEAFRPGHRLGDVHPLLASLTASTSAPDCDWPNQVLFHLPQHRHSDEGHAVGYTGRDRQSMAGQAGA